MEARKFEKKEEKKEGKGRREEKGREEGFLNARKLSCRELLKCISSSHYLAVDQVKSCVRQILSFEMKAPILSDRQKVSVNFRSQKSIETLFTTFEYCCFGGAGYWRL